jgi:DNA-binding response OmpR family regulator
MSFMPQPQKLRVLIVYGDRETADDLGQLFAACGQNVLVAYEETTAYVLARTQRPDLVVLDLRLHDEAMGSRLRRQIDVRGAALVAVAVEEPAADSTDHGFAHYLIEPVDPIQVQTLLKKLHSPE